MDVLARALQDVGMRASLVSQAALGPSETAEPSRRSVALGHDA